MKYVVIKNSLLRALLSKVIKNVQYISPNDVKSVLNYLRRGLEQINYVHAKGYPVGYDLYVHEQEVKENIRELERVR